MPSTNIYIVSIESRAWLLIFSLLVYGTPSALNASKCSILCCGGRQYREKSTQKHVHSHTGIAASTAATASTSNVSSLRMMIREQREKKRYIINILNILDTSLVVNFLVCYFWFVCDLLCRMSVRVCARARAFAQTHHMSTQ